MLSDSYLLCAAGTTDTFGGGRCGWPLKNLVLVLLAILAVNKVMFHLLAHTLSRELYLRLSPLANVLLFLMLLPNSLRFRGRLGFGEIE